MMWSSFRSMSASFCSILLRARRYFSMWCSRVMTGENGLAFISLSRVLPLASRDYSWPALRNACNPRVMTAPTISPAAHGPTS